MWGKLFTAFSGAGLLEFDSLMGVVGTFARTCGCGFFMRIFWCGFLCADFGVRIFFADFVMACADFGVRMFFFFFADYFGFSHRKSPDKKFHQENQPKNPHQRSSPRNVSSQYTTTLFRAKHSQSPQGVWVQMHLVENHFLCADGFCQGG